MATTCNKIDITWDQDWKETPPAWDLLMILEFLDDLGSVIESKDVTNLPNEEYDALIENTPYKSRMTITKFGQTQQYNIDTATDAYDTIVVDTNKVLSGNDYDFTFTWNEICSVSNYIVTVNGSQVQTGSATTYYMTGNVNADIQLKIEAVVTSGGSNIIYDELVYDGTLGFIINFTIGSPAQAANTFVVEVGGTETCYYSLSNGDSGEFVGSFPYGNEDYYDLGCTISSDDRVLTSIRFNNAGTANSTAIYTNVTSVQFIKAAALTSLASAFTGLETLGSLDLTSINAAQITNWGAAFNNYRDTSFPFIDISGADSLQSTWSGCGSLNSFPLLDTSNVTNFAGAWSGCYSLTSFPLLDTSSGTTFGSAWSSCSSLTSFPAIDTSSGIIFDNAWFNCTALTSFSSYDFSAGTSFDGSWEFCTKMADFSNLTFTSGTSFNNAFLFNTSSSSPRASATIMDGLSFPVFTGSIDHTDYLSLISASLTEVRNIDFPIADNLNKLFDSYVSGESKLEIIENITFPNCKDLTTSFRGNDDLTAINNVNFSLVETLDNCFLDSNLTDTFVNSLDLSSAQSVSSIFSGVTGLVNFTNENLFSNATDVTAVFYRCHSIETISNINLSSADTVRLLFSTCGGLLNIGMINTPVCTNFNNMFDGAANLVCFGSIDTTTQTSTSNMFNNVPAMVTPDNPDKVLIMNGANWTNPGSCP